MRRMMATIARLAPSWPAERVRNARHLPGGYANDNYRFDLDGDAFVVRVPRTPGFGVSGLSPGAGRSAERRYLGLGAAPRLVALDALGGAMITRFIKGPSLAAAPPPPTQAGAWLRSLHAAIPSGVRGYDPIAAAHEDLASIEDVAPAAAAALRRGWQPAERRGCHNDLNPWNVVRAAGGWRTLDWELAGDNDPLFDVVALAHGLGYEGVALQALLRAYYATPPPAARVRDAQIAFQLREYAWARRQARLGNGRREVREQAAAAATALAQLLEGGER